MMTDPWSMSDEDVVGELLDLGARESEIEAVLSQEDGQDRIRDLLGVYREMAEEREAEERREREAEEAKQDLEDAADAVESLAQSLGADVQRENSGLSEAIYLIITKYLEEDEDGLSDQIELKVRLANHSAKPTYELMYGAADIEYGNHDMASSDIEAVLDNVREALTARD